MTEESKNKYIDLKYKRGYLITTEQVPPPPTFTATLKINEYNISYDPANEAKLTEAEDHWVFVLGTIIDLENFTDDLTIITENLLSKYMKSEDSFLDYVDVLAGRHLIFYGNKDNAYILSDVTGMRTVFYSKNREFISSHSNLIQEYINSPSNPVFETKSVEAWKKKYKRAYLPGHYTIYEDIFLLTPNTLLEIAEKNVKRFFPRKKLENIPTDKVIQEVGLLIDKQMQMLTRKHQIICGLTGGIDSRVTLALVKNYRNQLKFFTYHSNPDIEAWEMDKKISMEIARNLDLNHELIDIEKVDRDDDITQFSKILRESSSMTSSPRQAKYYYDHFSAKNTLMLTSDIYAIMKNRPDNVEIKKKDLLIKNMAEVYSRGETESSELLEGFKNYYEYVQMDNIYDFDFHDLYYWEFRMGSWHAQRKLETDVALDSYVLINCRKIISLLLSVAQNEKKSAHELLIDYHWPILNYWEINSYHTLSDYRRAVNENAGVLLRSAKFNAGSNKHDKRQIQISSHIFVDRLKFHIEESQLKRGDFAEVEIPLQIAKSHGNYILIQLKTPFANKKNKGKAYYEILQDGECITREDMSAMKETNQISIKWTSLKRAVSRITIRVVISESLTHKNCSTLVIEKITKGKLEKPIDKKEISIFNSKNISTTKVFEEKSPAIKKKTEKILRQGKLNPIKENNLLTRGVSIGEIDKILQCLEEKKFYLFRGADVLEFKDGIDWEYQHSHSVSTYQVYLHSLDLVNVLCHQYKKTKEASLLEKALAILSSWLEYDKTAKENPLVKAWYDHAVACRVMAITLFFTLSRGVLKVNEEMIFNCLVKHALFLYEDKNYARNNHGIMMDQALVLSSIVLKSHKNAKHWENKALMRLKEAFNRDFSAKGTHLENSPDYHKMVMNLFLKTERFLNKNNLTLGEAVNRRLEEAKKYFAYLLKPNGLVPYLGDSSLEAVHSNQKKYEPFIDNQAGIAIFQHLDADCPERSTWMSFICGYGSKTHKHHDDLSVNLFWKGKDIFVDSGKYNYDKNSKYRQYMTSPLAHNVITVEGMIYGINSPLVDVEKIAITDFIHNPLYDLVKGKNLNYEGKELYRTFIFLKPNIIIIFDKVLGNMNSKGLQLFNLAPHIEILENKDNNLKIKSDDEIIEIIQLLEIDDMKIYHGDKDTPRAVISSKFAVLTDISQVEFSKKGKNLEFLTLIKLGEAGVAPQIKYDQRINRLTVKTDDYEIDLIL